MKARLVKRNDMLQLLQRNGKVKTVVLSEVRDFIKNCKNRNLLEGPDIWLTMPVSMDQYEGETLLYVTDKEEVIFESIEFLAELLNSEKSKYITIAEYAEKHGRSFGAVSKMCRNKRIPGLIKKGRNWLIPEDAPYPSDARVGTRTETYE